MSIFYLGCEVTLATCKTATGLVIPDSEAVILVFPPPTPVAAPDKDFVSKLIVAIAGLELVRVTLVLTSTNEPSEYFAIAEKC